MAAQDTLVAPGNQSHRHGVVPIQTRSERPSSYDVADFAVPNGREEEWRFSPVKKLKGLFADEPGTRAPRIDVRAPEGVTVETVAADAVRAGTPQDRIAAVAWAHAEKAVAVRIPADAELTEAVHVDVTALGEKGFGHLVIEAGRHSRAVVVIDHTGTGELAANTEIVVGDGADLRVVSIQAGDGGSTYVGQHDAVVGRDAKLNHVAVTLGGGIVRLSTNVRYDGPGGDAELLGVYFAETGQHHEHRSFVDHEAPQCKSHVTYKGALAGDDAHTVWIGDVLIRAAAEGTDTFELNRTWCSATAPGPTRCRTWRSRPARSWAPATPRRPAGSTTSRCSTCRPAASPRTRPGGWWSAGSSTTSSARSACPRWPTGCTT